MSSQPFATGSCSCGAVKIIMQTGPEVMIQCHCLDCQKTSGTGHTSNAYFLKDNVDIQGETSAHTVVADSGSKMTRCFCPSCGSRLFGYNSEKPDLISIQVGCIEDNSWYTPQMVYFASRKIEWDITSDETPAFDKMPMND